MIFFCLDGYQCLITVLETTIVSLAGGETDSATRPCLLELPSRFSRLGSVNHFILYKYWPVSTDDLKGEENLKPHLRIYSLFNS